MSTLEFDDVRDRGDGQRTSVNKLELDDMRDRCEAQRRKVSALREANLPIASPLAVAPRQKTTVLVAQPTASPIRRDAPARSKLLPAI
jgi:hypothetical protein